MCHTLCPLRIFACVFPAVPGTLTLTHPSHGSSEAASPEKLLWPPYRRDPPPPLNLSIASPFSFTVKDRPLLPNLAWTLGTVLGDSPSGPASSTCFLCSPLWAQASGSAALCPHRAVHLCLCCTFNIRLPHQSVSSGVRNCVILFYNTSPCAQYTACHLMGALCIFVEQMNEWMWLSQQPWVTGICILFF